MICPKCNSFKYFVRVSGGGVAECNNCKYSGSFIQPEYFNYHSEKYGRSKKRNSQTDPLIKKSMKLLNLNSQDIILDYGCGYGNYASEFKKYTDHVIGVDIDVEGAKLNYPNIDFIVQENTKLSFENNFFTVINCVNVIEHIHDYNYLLSEFHRVLQINGRLFITTLDKDFKLHRLINDKTHVIEWTKSEFINLFVNDFEIIKEFKFGSFFNYYPANIVLKNFIKPELCLLLRKK